MKLEQVLFPDGEVEEYEFKTDELKMLFKDSSNTRFLLCFMGDIEVKEKGSVGLSVYRSLLEKDGEQSKFRLLDDDLEEMLTIKFSSYSLCVGE